MNFSKKNHEHKKNKVFVSKKLITTIILVAITFTTVHSQITRPQVNVNTKTVNTKPAVQGLRVVNLDKMSAKDFAKLKIPLAQVIKEKANAKPTRTSRITPLRLNDGLLKYESFYGKATPKAWELQVYKSYWYGDEGTLPRLKFSFKFSADIYYNLRLKPSNEVSDDAKITLCEELSEPYRDSSFRYYDNCVDALKDDRGEFIFTLMKRNSKVAKFLIIVYQDNNIFSPFKLPEIRIDRLN